MRCDEEEVEEDECSEDDTVVRNRIRGIGGGGGGVPWDEDRGEGDVEFPVFTAEVFVGV